MSSNVSDPEPCTPAHLLYGRRIVPLPYPTTDGSQIDDPNQVVQHAQCYNTSNTVGDGKNEQCIKVGDIVLIHDDIPRAKWKMAVVSGTAKCYTRAANIRYSGGRTNRPIAKLYPLEVSSTNSDSNKVLHATTETQPPVILSVSALWLGRR